ncbi:MAG: cobalamin biosynthesis protein CbiA, partial [Candidatus Zixiibacteriota bacterium]
REAVGELQALGIAFLNLKEEYLYADLPIILPEIKGVIRKHQGKVIIDVGGDEVGTRVLSSLAEAFSPNEYELLLVVNANRPFTNDVEGCLKLIRVIETVSRLKLTGLISNTHLLTETDIETILAGLQLTRELSARTGLPVAFFSAAEDVLDQIDPDCVDVPVLALDRLLLKPWERRQVRPKGSSAKPGE